MLTAHQYLIAKSFHLFGVIIFLGNIIVTGFWKTVADFTKDWQIISFSQRLVTYTDIVFTTLGVIIIAITGPLMATLYGDFLSVKWIRWGFSLFIASGIIWLLILIPIQIHLSRLVKQHKSELTIPPSYWFYEKCWIIFGTIATLLPLMNLYWMVFKPF